MLTFLSTAIEPPPLPSGSVLFSAVPPMHVFSLFGRDKFYQGKNAPVSFFSR